MSDNHEEDAFEDAKEDLEQQQQRVQEESAEEETGETTEQLAQERSASPSKKKKNKKKKNKNKSASQSQLDLNEEEAVESETVQNAEDPQIPSKFNNESQENDTKQAEESLKEAQQQQFEEEEVQKVEEMDKEQVEGAEPVAASATDEAGETSDAVVQSQDNKEEAEPTTEAEINQEEVTESLNPSDPPLSKSTDSYQEDSKELEEENLKLEAKLQELQLLSDDDESKSQIAEEAPAPSLKGDTPALPDRSNTARPVPAPPLPSRDHHGGVVEEGEGQKSKPTFPFPIPPVPPKNDAAKPPLLPARNEQVTASPTTGFRAFATSPEDLPPPPLPPQLTSAQKSQHRGSVLSSWFGRGGSVSSQTPASEKSFEYEENYDLLLSRLSDNNEEFQSRDESFKEQVNLTENTLKSSYQEKISSLEDSTQDDQTKDSELDKIDWPFWTQVVNDYSSVAKSDPSRLSKEISRGIPKQIRGIIWQLVAKSNPKEFEDQFNVLLEKESPFEKNIQKDLARTSYITENGIDSDALYKVIKVYSLLDNEVGYTQGMAFITVPLLLNLNELESLSLLHKLMHSYNVRALYLPEMPGLLLSLYQFDRLVEDLLPNLHIHLQRQGVRSSMYASQWFLTFFAYKFPLQFVLRIFDIVITEGFESLLKFAIALVQKNEEKLLTLNFDELLEYLKVGLFSAYHFTTETVDADDESINTSNNNFGDFFKSKRPAPGPINVDTYDVDQLVEDATNVKIIPLTLKRYQEEYEEIHREEKERREEIEELRLRNNQLKREIRKIESSYTILNREHVQIANEMINGRMKIATLEDENNDLRDQNSKLRDRIKALQTPTDIEVPSSLEDDLKLTMERNLEVMTKNEELENQVSDLLQELESLRQKQTENEQPEKNLEAPSSPIKGHRHTSPTSNWTKSIFRR